MTCEYCGKPIGECKAISEWQDFKIGEEEK